MTPDQQFERELGIFRKETESATQFLFADLAVNEVARKRRAVFTLLNLTPMFWNTCLGSFQAATLHGARPSV